MPHRRTLIALALVLPLSTILACKRDRYSAEPGWDSNSSQGMNSSRSLSPSPTPRQVCEHLAQLIAAELGSVDPSVQAATIDACTTEMVLEEQLRGPRDWDLVARCVLGSYSDADIDRCDQLYPGPGVQANVRAREEEACVHIISMVLYESGGAEGVTDAELEGMQRECLAAFDEDRRTLSSAQYEGLVNCVLGANSTAQMEQCGNL